MQWAHLSAVKRRKHLDTLEPLFELLHEEVEDAMASSTARSCLSKHSEVSRFC